MHPDDTPDNRWTRPPKLQRGDRLAAVSPSWGGPASFPERYVVGKRQLEEALGVELVAMPNALRDAAWLARNPAARADDLHAAFADPSIQGVIATIGGDDGVRLLRHLDPGVFAANPKVFLGYSDATVVHCICHHAGFGSFYGPSVMAGFGENGGLFPYMLRSVEWTLFHSQPIGGLTPNADGWTADYLDWGVPENQARRRRLEPSAGWRFSGQGTARGRLLGGCLEVLDLLRGTWAWPSPSAWQGAILFLETSEEGRPPSAIVGFLRSLAAMGLLERLSGILFGRPGGPVAVTDFPAYDAAIQQVLAEEDLAHLPVVTRMDFGHTDPMLVLPYGVLAEIDAVRQRVALLEPAVVG